MNNLIILEYIKYIENKYSQGKKFKSKILDCIQDENFKYYSNKDIKKELDKPRDINYINEKVYNEDEFEKLEKEFDNEKEIDKTPFEIYLFESDIYLIVKEIFKKKKELNIDNFMEEIKEFRNKYQSSPYANKHADILEKIFNNLKK